jgi:enoyl-CoA hydratase
VTDRPSTATRPADPAETAADPSATAAAPGAGGPTAAAPSSGRLVDVELPAPGADGSIDHVALVTLRRPEVLNALNFALVDQLATALEALDLNADCRCVVITGSGERAFAAGADIKELAAQTPVTLTADDEFRHWNRINRIRKPLIAAVRGMALGGGLELAMACDMIVAADDARFGQPEIKLGVMPGAGGTQRLTRAIGKSRAMELILTGRTIGAREADAYGLVTRVVPAEATLQSALELGAVVAAQAPLAVIAAKEAVVKAAELPLEAGLAFERRNFYLLFATEDRREGMDAFTAKRPPSWKGR